MNKDNVIEFNNPAEITNQDLLTTVLRNGARELLAKAIEAEVAEFLQQTKDYKTAEGRAQFVRNGYLPERTIQTGIGDVAVKMPRVREQGMPVGIKFNSNLIPSYLRRSESVEELLPVLYLHGISTNNFQEALSALLGEKAKNLSPNVISRLKSEWEKDYQQWRQRDLSRCQYVYLWADGIYLQARMEEARDCLLVILGVTDQGRKEIVAMSDGFRESKESWQELLRDAKKRGLAKAPEIAVGDGALGFWAALKEVYPTTQHQRCWVHKTVNVLDKLPKALVAKAKSELHQIWMAETREEAEKAFRAFVSTYNLKYPKAAQSLEKDKKELLAFYDFPAEHWRHLRTTNPIESTFATVRHRTKRVKGCFSRTTILTMVFKMCQSAQKRWSRIYGFERVAEVIKGVKFVNGISSIKEKLTTGDNQIIAA